LPTSLADVGDPEDDTLDEVPDDDCDDDDDFLSPDFEPLLDPDFEDEDSEGMGLNLCKRERRKV
jgi:hypothetical protein